MAINGTNADDVTQTSATVAIVVLFMVPSVARRGISNLIVWVVRREVELGSRSHRAQRGHRIGEAEVRFGSFAKIGWRQESLHVRCSPKATQHQSLGICREGSPGVVAVVRSPAWRRKTLPARCSDNGGSPMSDDPNAWAPLEPNSTSQRTNPYNQITVGIRLATEGTMKGLLAGMIIPRTKIYLCLGIDEAR